MLKTGYYSLMYSHIQLYYNMGSSINNCLGTTGKMHKRDIRIIIINSPCRSHTIPIFKQLNLLKTNDVFKLKIVEKMRKYENNLQVHSTQTISNIKKTHNNIRHSFN